MAEIDWDAVEQAFDAALDCPPAERDRVLAGLPADVRAEVKALLSAHAQTETFLSSAAAETALVEAAADAVRDAMIGREVGPYRITGLIAQGGMGTVHTAERVGDMLGLPVALKLLPPGFATDDLIARFEEERRLLARLQHPHITRLLDGGEASGRPYFAMEYVDGQPITEFCEADRVGIDERLRLVLQVCDAVAYAHGQGIVHRDPKPPTLLVSGHGEHAMVKLLDFGIAKLLAGERAVLTRTGVKLYTPAYGAPEQITGDPVTEATDVYAIGMLLYVLLAGEHPYLKGDEPPFEAMKAVLETVPPPPSEAVPDARAAMLATTPAAMRARIRGGLDQVVLHAIAKTPAQRYASATALASDLRRVLRGKPIETKRANTFGDFLDFFRPKDS
jgi:serine/threonine-protein kinase